VLVNAREVDTKQTSTYARTNLLSSMEGYTEFTKVTNFLKIVLHENS
jgi:hypothetical protein